MAEERDGTPLALTHFCLVVLIPLLPHHILLVELGNRLWSAERSTRQPSEQDLRTTWDFVAGLNQELSSKVAALEASFRWEKAA